MLWAITLPFKRAYDKLATFNEFLHEILLWNATCGLISKTLFTLEFPLLLFFGILGFCSWWDTSVPCCALGVQHVRASLQSFLQNSKCRETSGQLYYETKGKSFHSCCKIYLSVQLFSTLEISQGHKVPPKHWGNQGSFWSRLSGFYCLRMRFIKGEEYQFYKSHWTLTAYCHTQAQICFGWWWQQNLCIRWGRLCQNDAFCNQLGHFCLFVLVVLLSASPPLCS